MNEKHCVSLKVARKLKDVGIEFLESGNVWANSEYRSTGFDETCQLFKTSMYSLFSGLDKEDIVRSQRHSSYKIFTSPSLSEILDILPVGYYIQKIHGINQEILFICSNIREKVLSLAIDNCTKAETAPDAAGLMLIKLEDDKKNTPS